MSNHVRTTALAVLLGLGFAAQAQASRVIVIDDGGAGSLTTWSNLDPARSRGMILTTGRVSFAEAADLRTRRVRAELPQEALDSFLARAQPDATRSPVALVGRAGPDRSTVVADLRTDSSRPAGSDILDIGAPAGEVLTRWEPRWLDRPSDLPDRSNAERGQGSLTLASTGSRLVLASDSPGGEVLALAAAIGAGMTAAPVVSAVPEPKAFAMLAAGLGLIGWKPRRRQKAQGRPAAA